MPLSTVTITGTWTRPDNTAPTGKVTFAPVQDAPGGGYIVVETAVTATLASGSISIVLVNNAQATTLQYLVTELIDGAPNVNYVITPAGSTLDLSTAPRGTLNATTPVYVLASTVGQPNGVASLDGAGKVPTSELPTSATGVLSVEAADSTITVAGTAQNPTVAAHTGITAGTVAAGNDARITGAIQSSTVTAKGDLLAATGADAVARVGVGTDGQALTADSTQTTGLRWGAVPPPPLYPAAGYGLISLTGAIESFGLSSGAGSGSFFLTRHYVAAGQPITGGQVAVLTAGTYTSGTGNQLALYDDTGALLTSSPDDSTLWATAGWAKRPFTAQQPAQAAGRYVWLGLLIVGFSGVALSYPAAANSSSATSATVLNSGASRRAIFQSGVSVLPASVIPASYGSNTAFMPLCGLY